MVNSRTTDMMVVLTPTDPEGYPIPGDVVVYTINITNQGSLTLHDVTPDSPQVGLTQLAMDSLKNRRPFWGLVHLGTRGFLSEAISCHYLLLCTVHQNSGRS